MDGPSIVASTLEARQYRDAMGRTWQYHSRSDHHSKVICWAALFDMLRESPRLCEHAAKGSLGFGINHRMEDFRQYRKKDLDLVLCKPANTPDVSAPTFVELAKRWDIQLTPSDRSDLNSLPELRESAVGSVYLALEAKACMTAHIKALPRLYDELNSSHLTVHGSSATAIAVALVMVNASDTFVSPIKGLTGPNVSRHHQPQDTERTIKKMIELPRRSHTNESGFDAFGIVVVNMVNDGGSVTVVTAPPAPPKQDGVHWNRMIQRAVHLYESRFPLL